MSVITVPGTSANPFLTKERTLPEHVVASGPKFQRKEPAESALMTCRCGWEGTVGEWTAHSPRTKVSYAWAEGNHHRPGVWQGATISMPNPRMIAP